MDIEFIYVDGSKESFSCDSYEFDNIEGFLLLTKENRDEEDEDVAYIRQEEIRSMSIK